MDISKVLAELRQELEHIETAIASLERLQYGSRAKRSEAASVISAVSEAPVEPPKDRASNPGRKRQPRE